LRQAIYIWSGDQARNADNLGHAYLNFIEIFDLYFTHISSNGANSAGEIDGIVSEYEKIVEDYLNFIIVERPENGEDIAATVGSLAALKYLDEQYEMVTELFGAYRNIGQVLAVFFQVLTEYVNANIPVKDQYNRKLFIEQLKLVLQESGLPKISYQSLLDRLGSW